MPKTPPPPSPLHHHLAIVHGRMARLAQLADDVTDPGDDVTDATIDADCARFDLAVTDFLTWLHDDHVTRHKDAASLAGALKNRLAWARREAAFKEGE